MGPAVPAGDVGLLEMAGTGSAQYRAAPAYPHSNQNLASNSQCRCMQHTVNFFLLIINNNDDYQYTNAFLKYYSVSPNRFFPYPVMLSAQSSIYSVFASDIFYPTSLSHGGIFSVSLFQKGEERNGGSQLGWRNYVQY